MNPIQPTAEAASLVLSVKQQEELIALINRHYPREACAALLGTKSGNQAVVRKIIALTNHSRSANRFAVSVRELKTALLNLESHLHYIGLFHSHSDGVALSVTDGQSIRRYCGIWLVGCLSRSDNFTDRLALEAYQMQSGEICSLPVRIR